MPLLLADIPLSSLFKSLLELCCLEFGCLDIRPRLACCGTLPSCSPRLWDPCRRVMRIIWLCSVVYWASIAYLRESVAIVEPLHTSDDRPLVGLQATSTAFTSNYQLLEADAPQDISYGGGAGLAPAGPQPGVVLQRLAVQLWTHGATMQISTLLNLVST